MRSAVLGRDPVLMLLLLGELALLLFGLVAAGCSRQAARAVRALRTLRPRRHGPKDRRFPPSD